MHFVTMITKAQARFSFCCMWL